MLTGCAFITSGRGQRIPIKSAPENAKVIVTDDGGSVVVSTNSPCQVTLQRGGVYARSSYKIKFEKEGYQPKEIVLSGKLNGWYFGNIMSGGMIGFAIVDPITGAMWTLHPKKIDVKLIRRSEMMQVPHGFVVDANGLLDHTDGSVPSTTARGRE